MNVSIFYVHFQKTHIYVFPGPNSFSFVMASGSKGLEGSQEFQIHNEDFPALPGAAIGEGNSFIHLSKRLFIRSFMFSQCFIVSVRIRKISKDLLVF